jgi:hypothetical protein
MGGASAGRHTPASPARSIALSLDPTVYRVKMERRLTDRNGTVYISVNASDELTVNGEVVAQMQAPAFVSHPGVDNLESREAIK